MYYEFCEIIAFVIVAALVLWAVRWERKLDIQWNVGIIKCGGIKISETFYMCSASNV